MSTKRYIWQTVMRASFYAELDSASRRGVSVKPGTDEFIRVFHYMSYCYAGLYAVIEGWRDLDLHDDEIDGLLESSNVELLRRYRHGVFVLGDDVEAHILKGFKMRVQAAERWYS
jgi:hypothetical protein